MVKCLRHLWEGFKCRILMHSMRGLLQRWTKIIHNSQFRRSISLLEQKAQKQDRFLRGRQIAYLIYDYFQVTGNRWFCRKLHQPVHYCSSVWRSAEIRLKVGRNFIVHDGNPTRWHHGRIVEIRNTRVCEPQDRVNETLYFSSHQLQDFSPWSFSTLLHRSRIRGSSQTKPSPATSRSISCSVSSYAAAARSYQKDIRHTGTWHQTLQKIRILISLSSHSLSSTVHNHQYSFASSSDSTPFTSAFLVLSITSWFIPTMIMWNCRWKLSRDRILHGSFSSSTTCELMCRWFAPECAVGFCSWKWSSQRSAPYSGVIASIQRGSGQTLPPWETFNNAQSTSVRKMTPLSTTWALKCSPELVTWDRWIHARAQDWRQQVLKQCEWWVGTWTKYGASCLTHSHSERASLLISILQTLTHHWKLILLSDHTVLSSSLHSNRVWNIQKLSKKKTVFNCSPLIRKRHPFHHCDVCMESITQSRRWTYQLEWWCWNVANSCPIATVIHQLSVPQSAPV